MLNNEINLCFILIHSPVLFFHHILFYSTQGINIPYAIGLINDGQFSPEGGYEGTVLVLCLSLCIVDLSMT
jgi:hypothetical protein